MFLPRFHSSVYRMEGQTYRTTWWQLGDRIFRQRDYVLREGF